MLVSFSSPSVLQYWVPWKYGNHLLTWNPAMCEMLWFCLLNKYRNNFLCGWLEASRPRCFFLCWQILGHFTYLWLLYQEKGARVLFTGVSALRLLRHFLHSPLKARNGNWDDFFLLHEVSSDFGRKGSWIKIWECKILWPMNFIDPSVVPSFHLRK